MQTRKLLPVFLVAALYGGHVIAAEPVTAPAPAKKSSAVKKKIQQPKKDCVEKDGKPCHLHQHGKASGVVAAKPAAQAKAAPSAGVDAAAPAVAVAASAPVAAAVAKPEAAKVETKTEAVLSDAEGRKLAQKSGCFMCHAIDKKAVGPAWKDIAAKYRGDANSEAKLITKVAKGGGGVWGSAPMPANAPRVSDADIKSLVRFVLSLK